MDINQTSRFSKTEMELIKATFVEDKILYAIRKVFFQFELAESDKELLKTLTPALLDILRKFFLPEPIADTPILQQADLYFSLSGKIKEINPAVAELQIEAEDLKIAYLEQQFSILTGYEVPQVISLADMKVKGNKSQEERYVNMLAYLSLTNAYVDSCLNGLKTLANKKEDTPEEQKKKATANSSK